MQSNLFPGPALWPGRLAPELRGASALRRYLVQAAPGIPLDTAMRHLLRPWQQAELAYELGCERCGAVPEGRVRTAEADRIEFRCPAGRCEHSSYRPLRINVDIEVLERFQSRYGLDISEPARKALDTFAQGVGDGISLGDRYTQMPVRFTLTQYYLFKSQPIPEFSKIVHACLLAWEEKEHA